MVVLSNKLPSRNADVLLVRSVTRVDESLLKNSKVGFVGSATSGIDHIDTDYLKKSNISFAHAPGSNARSVAEYVLSSLFATAEYNGFDLTQKTDGHHWVWAGRLQGAAFFGSARRAHAC